MSNKVRAGIYACVTFLVSLWVFSFYDAGDQAFYRFFYEHVASLPLAEALIFYKNQIGSSEPVYFFFVYLLSPILNKDLLFSAVNGVLAYFSVLWLLKNQVSRNIIILLCVNFYVIVILFSAERLKLALLFFVLASVVKLPWKYLLWCCSVLSHMQTAILLCISLSDNILALPKLLKRKILSKELIYFSVFLVSLVVGIYILKDHLIFKITSYAQAGGIKALFKPVIFLLLTLWVARKEAIAAVVSHLPLLAAAFIIGEGRIVIFSYFVFLYYGLRYKNGLNLPVIATSIYFMLGGFVFLFKIFTYGQGFYGGASWIQFVKSIL